MAATNEMDILLRKAIKFLHSKNSNSATEIRLLLDEAIKQRFGPEKMLCNILSQRHLEEEINFPGRVITPPPQPEEEEVINLTSPNPKGDGRGIDSPETIIDSDDNAGESMEVGGNSSTTHIVGSILSGSVTAGADDSSDVNLKEFGDLNCCVCSEIMFTATNRLMECSKCGTLYHQECHKPPITEEEASLQEHTWLCDDCCNKPSTSKGATGGSIILQPDEPVPLVAVPVKAASKASSRSSSCSNSSSPFYKQELSSPSASTAGGGKHHHHHRSSKSSSHKEERSGSGSKSSAADKSSSSSSSSRKSSHSSSTKSSTSKSSKHHDSGSSKRSKPNK